MTGLTAFLWARWRIARNVLASAGSESKLKIAVVSLSALGLWFGLFWLARFGFGLVADLAVDLGPSPGGRSLGGTGLAQWLALRLLGMLALVVFSLLTVSNTLVAYGTIFRSRDVPPLTLSPLSPTAHGLGRLLECVSFSSWATAFLGSPVLLAWGLAAAAPVLFYPALVLFFVPFVLIPAGVGMIVALGATRLLAGRRWLDRRVGIALAALAAGALALVRARLRGAEPADTVALWLGWMERGQHPFLPSQWLASGVTAAVAGRWGEALFQWGLLATNAALLVWAATWAAEAWLLPALSQTLGGEGGGRPAVRGLSSGTRRGAEPERLERWLGWVREPERSLVAKDLRTFWREPSQWSQFVLFFGILGLYVATAGGGLGDRGPAWQSLGAVLHLLATLLVLASLTTRFVFPLLSLEGRRFWLLGLSPLPRRRLLWQKFSSSVALCSVFTLVLAVLGGWRLGLDASAVGWLAMASVAATLALSGLAVGLGALFPNFSEDNPSRIVSGLGGTLTFVLSMVYVVLLAGPLALVLAGEHLAIAATLDLDSLRWRVLSGALAWTVLLTAVATWIPLRLGARHLDAVEF